MRFRCPRCRSLIDAQPGEFVVCPECGYESATPRPKATHGDFLPVEQPPHEAPARPPPVHRPRPLTRERIAFGLAANVLLPGAGTMLTGREAEGWGQLLLFIVGLATIPILIGLALAPAAWVWALVSSIQHLSEFDRRRPSRP